MRSIHSVVLALLIALPGCSDINGPVQAVMVELSPGGAQVGFLTIGDIDTVHAQAGVAGWPAKIKYDSDTAPQLFEYSSSNPQVARVDRRGVITAVSQGVTTLHASIEGVQSFPLSLTVSPAAAQLLAEPGAISAAVGDTLTITVSAVDGNGQAVVGVPFNIFIDTPFWAVVSPPFEGYSNFRTPMTLHFTAKTEGTVRLMTGSLHERLAESLRAVPISIAVRAP
jgi:Bacterial Ig-like domain (group 2)